MPARKVLIDRFISGKQPTLKQLALDTGAGPLDMLWGKYFATGSYEPVLRMVSILDWCKDANNAKNVECMQPDRHVFIEVSGTRLKN